MTLPTIKRSDYVEFADRELENWPGVPVERSLSKRHLRVTLTFNGKSRFVIAPATGSDARGPLNHVQDLRQVLRELGAERASTAKAAVRRTRHARRTAAPSGPITLPAPEALRKDPTRDPFAALATMQFAAPAPVQPPKPTPQPWWRKALQRLFRSAA